MQEEVAVEPDDTPETLAARIHEVEYTLYPRAIVAALSKIDEHGEREQTPPPVPPMEEWAQKLGVEYRQTSSGSSKLRGTAIYGRSAARAYRGS